MYEQARAAADRATSGDGPPGEPSGQIAGVPVTHQGSRLCRGRAARCGGAPANKASGARPSMPPSLSALRAAGAIVTCKTTTCESGYKLTADSPVSGITRNPWNPGSHQRRIERRCGGGRRRRLRSDRDRHRWRRFDPRAVVVLRRVRDQADLRPRAAVARISRRRHGRRWRIPARSRARSPTPRCCWRSIAGYDLRDAASLPVPARSFDASAGRAGRHQDRQPASISAMRRWRPMCARRFSRRSTRSVRCGAQHVPDCVRSRSRTCSSAC